MFKLIILVVVLFLSSTKADDNFSAATASVPPPIPPGGLGGIFPGLGFHKNLDINAGAGFGPFLGGLGLGGPAVDDGGPVLGGGYPSLGLLGPSYIPSTWIGSALGAKGDLLFPIVIFVFFIVGIWTVVQFLLSLIVPLIAAKFSILQGVTHISGRREVTLEEEKHEHLNHLTQAVMDALDHAKCMPTAVCHVGNLVFPLGADKINNYEESIAAIPVMTPDLMNILKTVAVKGNVDCTKYACKESEDKN